VRATLLRVGAGCAVLGSALAVAPGARADISLVEVGSFTSPTYVTAPSGDPDRIFVTEKGGKIEIVRDGVKLAQPFLDISADVVTNAEQGLGSMAFAPDYASSGLFYVEYTAPRSGDADGSVVTVEEFRRSSTDPDRADPGSGRVVLTVDHPDRPYHNGGQLQFGPDGMLYISVGDGGLPLDSANNAQTTGVLLGKILRIDPRQAGAYAYTIPPDNPFLAVSGARPEVYDYGLRNPWRFSFDRLNGDLVIGDVGESDYEEIDYAPQGTDVGVDYGWRCKEGLHDTPTLAPRDRCTPSGTYVDPVFEYPHVSSGSCRGSITGGYVVRDQDLISLYGRYVYGDFCLGTIRSLMLGKPSASEDQALPLSVPHVDSFGEDGCGHVYVASFEGPVYRLAGDKAAPCPKPPPPPPVVPPTGGGGNPPPPPPPPDETPPRLTLDGARVQHLLSHRAIYIGLRCSEPCGVVATTSLAIPRARRATHLAKVSVTLPPHEWVRLGLRIPRKDAHAVLHSLRGRRRVLALITVVARDASGNETRRSFRVYLVR